MIFADDLLATRSAGLTAVDDAPRRLRAIGTNETDTRIVTATAYAGVLARSLPATDALTSTVFGGVVTRSSPTVEILTAPAPPAVQTTSTGTQTTAATSTTVTYPAGIVAGDLLVFLGGAAADITSTLTGFTAQSSGATAGVLELVVLTRTATGSESGTITWDFGGTSTVAAWAMLRISGASGTVENAAYGSVTSTTAVNPPSVTASWGAASNLFIGVGSYEDGNISMSGGSSNLDGDTNVRTSTTAPGVGLVFGHTVQTAATFDPFSFTLSAATRRINTTLVIRPQTGANIASVGVVTRSLPSTDVLTSSMWVGTLALSDARPDVQAVSVTSAGVLLRSSAVAEPNGAATALVGALARTGVLVEPAAAARLLTGVHPVASPTIQLTIAGSTYTGVLARSMPETGALTSTVFGGVLLTSAPVIEITGTARGLVGAHTAAAAATVSIAVPALAVAGAATSTTAVVNVTASTIALAGTVSRSSASVELLAAARALVGLHTTSAPTAQIAAAARAFVGTLLASGVGGGPVEQTPLIACGVVLAPSAVTELLAATVDLDVLAAVAAATVLAADAAGDLSAPTITYTLSEEC